MKIKTKLFSSFLGILIVSIILNIITIFDMITLSDLTTKLYRHPMAVSVEVQRINGNITEIIYHTQKIINNSDFDNNAYNNIIKLEDETTDSLKLLHERFLGEKSRVEKAQKIFNEWKPVRDYLIGVALEKGVEQANIYGQKFEQPIVDELNDAMNYLSEFAKNKGVEFYTNASSTRVNSIRKSIILLVWVFALAIFLVKFLADKISRPLLLLNENMRSISKGRADLTARLNSVSKDEIGELSRNFDIFIEKLQTLAQNVKGNENIESEKNLILSKVMDNMLSGKSNEEYLSGLCDLIEKIKSNSGDLNIQDKSHLDKNLNIKLNNIKDDF